MYVIDTHCDSIEMVSGECGLRRSHNFSDRYSQLQFTAFFCGHEGESEAESYERYKRYLRALDSSVRADKGLVRCTAVCEAESALAAGSSAVMLSLESAEPLEGDIERLGEFYRDGVRMAGLVWSCNRYGSSSHANEPGGKDTGLTPLGRQAVEKCNELGIVIDVSHMSQASFYDAACTATLPIIASHSNFSALCRHPRNLTDEQALQIKQKGGVIGINLYNPVLCEDAENADMTDILRHIDYGISLVGEDHIGFGCDIDGTSGIYPRGFDEGSSMHDKIINELLKIYPCKTVEKISWKNHMNYLKRAFGC